MAQIREFKELIPYIIQYLQLSLDLRHGIIQHRQLPSIRHPQPLQHPIELLIDLPLHPLFIVLQLLHHIINTLQFILQLISFTEKIIVDELFEVEVSVAVALLDGNYFVELGLMGTVERALVAGELLAGLAEGVVGLVMEGADAE